MTSNRSFDDSGSALQQLCRSAYFFAAKGTIRIRRAIQEGIALLFLVCTLASAQIPTADHKIQVLIITGQDKHPWRETSPYLKDLLNQAGEFEVRVTEEFRGATAETLQSYDVVVLDYSDEKLNIPEWSDVTKNALLDFVRSGKGLVVYHQDCRHSRQPPITKSPHAAVSGEHGHVLEVIHDCDHALLARQISGDELLQLVLHALGNCLDGVFGGGVDASEWVDVEPLACLRP